MRNGLFVCRERERESEEGGNQRALVFCRFTVSTFFSFFVLVPFRPNRCLIYSVLTYLYYFN